MSIWYRIQDADRDPQALLDPANQWSATWHPTWTECTECTDGIVYGPDGEDDSCTRCDGKGGYHDPARRGVSVCARLDELTAYFRTHNVHPDFWADEVVIALEGELSGEDDFDADEAFLVIPSQIVSVTPVREVPELAALLEEVGA